MALGELHTDHRRGDRGAEHRQELEHQRAQERDPQRAERLVAVTLADCPQRSRLRLFAPVGAQRRQPAHHLEEVRAEHRERALALPRVLGRALADEHHEDDHDRQRDAEQHAHEQRPRRDHAHHADRHRGGQRELRHRPRVVLRQRVQPVGRGGGDVAATRAVHITGPAREGPVGHELAQPAERDLRRAPPRELHHPGQHGPGGDHQQQAPQDLPGRDRVGHDPRLRDEQRGREQPGARRDPQRHPRPRGDPQQPPVQHLPRRHRSCSSPRRARRASPPGSRLKRE